MMIVWAKPVLLFSVRCDSNIVMKSFNAIPEEGRFGR